MMHLGTTGDGMWVVRLSKPRIEKVWGREAVLASLGSPLKAWYTTTRERTQEQETMQTSLS